MNSVGLQGTSGMGLNSGSFSSKVANHGIINTGNMTENGYSSYRMMSSPRFSPMFLSSGLNPGRFTSGLDGLYENGRPRRVENNSNQVESRKQFRCQMISEKGIVALVLARGTAIHKSIVVPLFALHAPSSIIAGIKGEYGVWAAFVALIARLFVSFPGELELPFIALMLVIVAPIQVMNIRGKQEGAILSLAISCFLAFQHFSRAGSLQKAYEQGSVLATVAIISVTVVSLLFLL